MLLNNIVESKLLYVNNKILEWFNNKSEEEKKKLLYKLWKKIEYLWF